MKLNLETSRMENAMSNEEMRKQNRPPPQSKTHAIILYPENPQHMNILHYLQTQTVYKFIAMRHKSGGKITEEDEELQQQESMNGGCKEHIHVMVEVPKKQTAKGFQRIFGGIIEYSITVMSPIDYMLYMQHKTFKSQYIDQKEPYEANEFISNDIQYFLKQIDTDNEIEEVAAIVEMCRTATIDEVVLMIAQCEERQRKALWEAFKKNTYLTCQISNQILRYKGVGVNNFNIVTGEKYENYNSGEGAGRGQQQRGSTQVRSNCKRDRSQYDYQYGRGLCFSAGSARKRS